MLFSYCSSYCSCWCYYHKSLLLLLLLLVLLTLFFSTVDSHLLLMFIINGSYDTRLLNYAVIATSFVFIVDHFYCHSVILIWSCRTFYVVVWQYVNYYFSICNCCHSYVVWHKLLVFDVILTVLILDLHFICGFL